MVYLIHFTEKLHHAQHYLGYTSKEDMGSRLGEHRAGQGARILRACNEAGIDYVVVRTWPDGTRDLERSLKNKKCTRLLCPVCNETIQL